MNKFVLCPSCVGGPFGGVASPRATSTAGCLVLAWVVASRSTRSGSASVAANTRGPRPIWARSELPSRTSLDLGPQRIINVMLRGPRYPGLAARFYKYCSSLHIGFWRACWSAAPPLTHASSLLDLATPHGGLLPPVSMVSPLRVIEFARELRHHPDSSESSFCSSWYPSWFPLRLPVRACRPSVCYREHEVGVGASRGY